METTTTTSADREAVATALNRCVETAIDGQKNYGAAAADVRPQALKDAFRAYETQRAGFVAELQKEIASIGAWPENRGSARGALHRGFANARLIIEGHNEEAIITECMHGDANILRVYEQLLTGTIDFPERTYTMLVGQRDAVKAALDDMKKRLAFPLERYKPVQLGPSTAS